MSAMNAMKKRPGLVAAIAALLFLGGVGVGAIAANRLAASTRQAATAPPTGAPTGGLGVIGPDGKMLPTPGPGEGGTTVPGMEKSDVGYRGIVMDIKPDGVGVDIPDVKDENGVDYKVFLNIGASTQLAAFATKTPEQIAAEYKAMGFDPKAPPKEGAAPTPPPAIKDPYRTFPIKLSDLREQDVVKFNVIGKLVNGTKLDVSSVTWIASVLGIDPSGRIQLTSDFHTTQKPPEPGGPTPESSAPPAGSSVPPPGSTLPPPPAQ